MKHISVSAGSEWYFLTVEKKVFLNSFSRANFKVLYSLLLKLDLLNEEIPISKY